MNAVEIEAAISDLALEAFDPAEFPFAFLAAFGHKETALKRLRAGNNNTSDIPGGVLLRNHIHLAVCTHEQVGATLQALRASPATAKAKARFILATDGQTLEAEELASGDTIAPAYVDFPNHLGFFLPLAGITTVKEIKDNPVDVRATGRLNKLYVELLRENPDWATEERRVDMNHFMARLIFCFFAEDTDIFNGEGLFTQSIEQWSERDGGNTHQVLAEIFRAMNIKSSERAAIQPRLPNWANGFPYVNGGLFSGSTDAPRFTRMARTYLIHSQPTDGSGLIMSAQEAIEMVKAAHASARFIYGYIGSDEISTGKIRKCLWISDEDAEIAANIPVIAARLEVVKASRIKSPKKQTNDFAAYPHRFTER